MSVARSEHEMAGSTASAPVVLMAGKKAASKADDSETKPAVAKAETTVACSAA
jgi:hypothetical protein